MACRAGDGGRRCALLPTRRGLALCVNGYRPVSVPRFAWQVTSTSGGPCIHDEAPPVDAERELATTCRRDTDRDRERAIAPDRAPVHDEDDAVACTTFVVVADTVDDTDDSDSDDTDGDVQAAAQLRRPQQDAPAAARVNALPAALPDPRAAPAATGAGPAEEARLPLRRRRTGTGTVVGGTPGWPALRRARSGSISIRASHSRTRAMQCASCTFFDSSNPSAAVARAVCC